MDDKILSLLEEKQFSEIKKRFSQMHAADIAEQFDDMENRETAVRLFRLLSKETAADVFAYMDPDSQELLISAMTDTELHGVLEGLFMDDIADLAEEMPASVVKRIMQNVNQKDRAMINQYLNYPEDSAGSIMTCEYVYLKESLTIREAFDVIRKTGLDKETVYTCYTIDSVRHLLGSVTVLDMLMADPEKTVASVTKRNPVFVHTLDDQEDVAKMFQKYDLLAIPVVDKEERLVGIVTIDDAVDVIQEENTEDFEKMAGMAPSERSYLQSSVWDLAKRRILWLMVLMVSAMVTGALLESYEAAISAIPLLVSFIPMLMDTGGNSGSQASTMIIRGMALDEITPGDFLKVWFKEFRVALMVGSALSAVNFLRIMIQYQDLRVALVVSLTMIGTVVVAKSMGCMLPMLAKRLRLDPAITASPMITTITDALTIFLFFSLAKTFLPI